jgi:hypothetical protein
MTTQHTEDPTAEIDRLKAERTALLDAIKSHIDLYNAGLLTDPQRLEEHTLRLSELYTDIINA